MPETMQEYLEETSEKICTVIFSFVLAGFSRKSSAAGKQRKKPGKTAVQQTAKGRGKRQSPSGGKQPHDIAGNNRGRPRMVC